MIMQSNVPFCRLTYNFIAIDALYDLKSLDKSLSD